MEILTKFQELRHFGQTFEALKSLVAAPESRVLLHNIQIGQIGGNAMNESLFLTNEGLMEVATNDFRELVEPSIKLVRKYNLNGNDLVDLLARLKA